MGATNSRSFRGVEVSTLSHIAILLLISILAIIHLKPIIQPLVVATLLFFLIRPPAQWLEEKYGHYPICVAKTQYSFSTDPNLRGAPKDHVVPIREVRLAASAEFLVVVCDKIMTMPGLQ